MQRYQCHKIVEAAKITEIEVQVQTIRFEGETAFRPTTWEWWGRFYSEITGALGTDDLGYFVRYADGYESWSPTAVFEAGYEAIVDNQVTVQIRRPPGHACSLLCAADVSYAEVQRRVEDFLQRAFFGVDADGNLNPVVPAEEADRGWRGWVSFMFTDNTDRFKRMTDGELRAYVSEHWDAVQKGALVDGSQV